MFTVEELSEIQRALTFAGLIISFVPIGTLASKGIKKLSTTTLGEAVIRKTGNVSRLVKGSYDDILDWARRTLRKRASKLDISDDVLKWLNKGDADNVVYYGIKNNEAVYTGITKQDLAKRLYQHNYSGKGFQSLEEVVSGLTKNQARAVEQYLIENGSASALNKINSISPNAQFYDEAMQWAKTFIETLK